MQKPTICCHHPTLNFMKIPIKQYRKQTSINNINILFFNLLSLSIYSPEFFFSSNLPDYIFLYFHGDLVRKVKTCQATPLWHYIMPLKLLTPIRPGHYSVMVTIHICARYITKHYCNLQVPVTRKLNCRATHKAAYKTVSG